MNSDKEQKQNRSLRGFAYDIFALLCVIFVGSVLQMIPVMQLLFSYISKITAELTALLESGAITEQQALKLMEQFTTIFASPEFMSSFFASEPYVLMTLFGTAGSIAALFILVLAFQKQSLTVLGLSRGYAVSKYVIGMAVGLAMFSAAIGICMATGAVSVTLGGTENAAMIFAFFFAFLIQGMEEELLFRGFLFERLRLHMPLLPALGISSLLFSAMHLSNTGISLTAIINLTLFGVFTGLLYLYTGSIWCPAAAHSVWNFAQGNFFGCPVSGINAGSSVFKTVLVQGRDLTHGGIFGPEGGVAVTLVLVISDVLLLMLLSKKKEKQK